MSGKIEIYQAKDGQSSVEVTFDSKTVWLSLSQISELFGRDKSVISRHLRNIFTSGELADSATVAKNATVQIEGKRKVEREVKNYNLDAILSVGYRVNSKQGTQFRIWATDKLRRHLVDGFTANESRLKQLRQSVQLIRATVSSELLESQQVKEIVDVLSEFALGLDILDGYDHQNLEPSELHPHTKYVINYEEAKQAIEELRIKFGGSALFGNEKDKSFKSSIATINQTFGGQDLYPSK